MPGLLEDMVTNFSLRNLSNFLISKNENFTIYNPPQRIYQYETERFRNIQKIGTLILDDNRELQVFSIETEGELTERSSKKVQYEIAKNLLKITYAPCGIFIFYDESGNFRFSLVYEIPLGRRRTFSNFKRFTYYVSKNQTNKTFLKQIGEGDFSSLEKIKEAFSVEKVTKEFYQEISNWYFWALKHVKFPDGAESEQNGRNIAVIRLITRLIFIWFMKQKAIVPDYLFDYKKLKDILKDLSDNESTYYKAILQNLFFATLNTKQEERRFRDKRRFYKGYNPDFGNQYVYRYYDLFKDSEKIREYFGDIPFLNGGLFECLDDGRNNIYIDGFTERSSKYQPIVPNFLFFSDERTVDLSSDYGQEKYRKAKVRGLIEILKSYNFTIDENTPVDEEVALDPELLGKVFENLLASYNPETATTARKATGSYYTPREIVDYMVEESLKAYFKNNLPDIDENKLNKLFSYEDEENPFDTETTKRLIHAINNLKIIDPAVGSGAFPMGILHRLVHILHKLDPHNELWKEEQIRAVLQNVTDPKLKQELIEKIEESFSLNELDYGRKLYLIQNCIYGVDIQPIAIQIAKLRFFISLLVDEKVDKTKPNWGIEPLPNLETKFVAANTLIGLERPKQLTLQADSVREIENKLKKVREEYFITADVKRKEKLKEEDKRLRAELSEALSQSGFPSQSTEKIASWDPYDTNTSADWFDPEWMFGVTDGFDIVIGNPPYGVEVNNVDALARDYDYFDRQKNSASFFIELGSRLANIKGVVAYIVPKSLSFSEGWKKTRELIAHKNRLISVIDVSKAFDAVLLEQIIICFSKENYKSNYEFLVGEGWNKEIRVRGKGDAQLIKLYDILPMYVDNRKKIILNKLQKGSVLLSEVSTTFRGLPLQRLVTNSGQPILRGRNIGRYKIYGDIDYITLPNEIQLRKKVRELLKPKIISQNIVAHVMNPYDRIIIMATLDSHGFLTLDTVMNTFLTIDRYAPQYVLAILNSQLASWFFYWFVYNRAVRTMHFDKYYINKLPLKDIDSKSQQPFITLVDQILAAKKQNPNADTSSLERQIDELVYKLYDLTDDEIAIIEGQILI